MINRILKLFLILFVLSCEEVEIEKRDYPYIFMKSVEQVNEGKLLVAEVMDKGSSTVKSYGFVWNSNGSPNMEEDSVLIVLPTSEFGEGEFNAVIESGQLEKFNFVYVRPYVETDDNLIYGNEVFASVK